jgi:hypothetical protein
VRLRTLGAVAAMVLVAAGLAGCRTNVGVAATIDGQRVTETQVNDYLTPSAKPVVITSGGTALPPRSFVVNTLIEEKLFAKLLAATPAGLPSDGQLSSIQTTDLAGKSVHAIATQLHVVGYTSDFEQKYIGVEVLGSLLSKESSQGVDVNTLANKLKFPVSVNPRYGTWDRASFTVATGAQDGLPGFLTLQPTAGSSAAAGSTGS